MVAADLFRYILEKLLMKKFEVNRMAVIIDIMSECTGYTASSILARLQNFAINEEELNEITTVLNEMDE